MQCADLLMFARVSVCVLVSIGTAKGGTRDSCKVSQQPVSVPLPLFLAYASQDQLTSKTFELHHRGLPSDFVVRSSGSDDAAHSAGGLGG